MAQLTINYTATQDLSSFSTWLTNNVASSTYDSTTQEGTLTLNEGITQIEGGAFQNCSALLTVNIPEGITKLGNNIFLNCSNMTFAEIPSTMTSIQNQAFWGDKLKIIKCNAVTPPYLIANNFNKENDVLYVPTGSLTDYQNSNWSSKFLSVAEWAGNAIITYHSSVDLSTYSTWITNNAISSTYDSTTQIGTIEVLPYEIGEEAFKNCTTLTEIAFTNIVIIDYQAFGGCSNLTNISFPNSLKLIQSQAFYNCASLTSINLPSSLTELSSSVFALCSSLTTINLPNSLTSIEAGVFQECSSLTSFTIPSSVTRLYRNSFIDTGWWNNQSDEVLYKDGWCLGYKSTKPTGDLTINVDNVAKSAFTTCTELTSVTFGNLVTRICGDAFYGCNGLTSVILGTSLTRIENSVFNNCTSLTTLYWNAENLTSYSDYSSTFNSCPISNVIFGNSVQSLPPKAFKNCTGITSIILPSSLTSIGTYSFNGCTNLLSVTCLATTPPSLSYFNFTASGDTLYVPSASKSAYQSDSQWSTAFTNYVGLYEVTSTVTGSGSVSPSPATVPEGESATLTITPAEGNGIFSVTDNGTSVPVTHTGMTYTISNIAADHAIAVVFKPYFEINIQVTEGGSLSFPDMAFAGEDFTITATPNEGFDVNEFVVDGTDLGRSVYSYTFQAVDSNHSVEVVFSPIYNITIESTEGGTIEGPSIALGGDDVTFTITPNEGMIIFNVLDNDVPVPVNPLGMTYTISNIQANHTIEVIFAVEKSYGFDLSNLSDDDYIIQIYEEKKNL